MYLYCVSEIWTNLSYGHPLIPRCPDKRGLTVCNFMTYSNDSITHSIAHTLCCHYLRWREINDIHTTPIAPNPTRSQALTTSTISKRCSHSRVGTMRRTCRHCRQYKDLHTQRGGFSRLSPCVISLFAGLTHLYNIVFAHDIVTNDDDRVS